MAHKIELNNFLAEILDLVQGSLHFSLLLVVDLAALLPQDFYLILNLALNVEELLLEVAEIVVFEGPVVVPVFHLVHKLSNAFGFEL